MTDEKNNKVDIKQSIKSLEKSLKQIEETEVCQQQLIKSYKVPYPVPIKYNLAASAILYILFKQGMPYGGWLILAWFGWQICINGIYFGFKLYKKRPQIAQWKSRVNLNIEELQKTCIVPQKYWYSNAVQYFIRSLKSGKAKTIEECIALYEED